MARTSQRGSKNNNPDGKNQYSNGYGDMARERPLATALGTAAAVGAGVFLWSRRNQISEQLSNLSEQIGEWTQGSGSVEFETADGQTGFSSTATSEAGGGASAGTSGRVRA